MSASSGHTALVEYSVPEGKRRKSRTERVGDKEGKESRQPATAHSAQCVHHQHQLQNQQQQNIPTTHSADSYVVPLLVFWRCRNEEEEEEERSESNRQKNCREGEKSRIRRHWAPLFCSVSRSIASIFFIFSFYLFSVFSIFYHQPVKQDSQKPN